MGRIFISLFAFLIAVSSFAQTRLTVLTYNLHHCEGTDGKLDVERIASVINKVHPDLVALQEVDNNTNRTHKVDQAKELARLTGMHSMFGQAMSFDSGWYGDAILSKYEIGEVLPVHLPYKAIERHEPRLALSAHIRLPSGEEITFISTHLDHTGGKMNDRAEQARKINEMFEVTPFAILGGDLNATPDSEAMKILKQQWSDSSADHPEPTIPSDKPNRKIDYVLYKPADKWKVVETKVIDEEVASDHRPFLAVLELK